MAGLAADPKELWIGVQPVLRQGGGVATQALFGLFSVIDHSYIGSRLGFMPGRGIPFLASWEVAHTELEQGLIVYKRHVRDAGFAGPYRQAEIEFIARYSEAKAAVGFGHGDIRPGNGPR